MKSRPAFIVALGLGLVVGASAMAQSMNRPYVPGGGGAGFSLAGRQAILNEEFTGNTPRVLFRGPDGGLLSLAKRNNNAYLHEPGGGNFLPGARPGRGWPTGLGTGLGWNNAGFSDGGGSYGLVSLGRSRSLNSWIALLPASADDTGGGGFRSGATPIDTWISQLGQL